MTAPADDFDIEEQKAAGAREAQRVGATEHYPYGETSPTVYAYTYWFTVGYNEDVDARTKKRKK